MRHRFGHRRPLLRVTWMTALMFCAGCGTPTAPTPPTPTPAPLIMTVTGSVVDTAHRPLVAVKVEVVGGERAGAFAMTDQYGRFVMPGLLPRNFTLSVTKDGYVSATRSWPPEFRPPDMNDVDFWIELSLIGQPVNLTGVYTLAFETDPDCPNWPEQLRTRTYTATITPMTKPTDFNVAVSGGQLLPPYDRFGIQTAGDYVRFDVYRYFDFVEPAIVERISDTAVISILGTAENSFSTLAAPVPFDGVIEFCPGQVTGSPPVCSTNALTCTSAHHRFTIARK